MQYDLISCRAWNKVIFLFNAYLAIKNKAAARLFRAAAPHDLQRCFCFAYQTNNPQIAADSKENSNPDSIM